MNSVKFGNTEGAFLVAGLTFHAVAFLALVVGRLLSSEPGTERDPGRGRETVRARDSGPLPVLPRIARHSVPSRY